MRNVIVGAALSMAMCVSVGCASRRAEIPPPEAASAMSTDSMEDWVEWNDTLRDFPEYRLNKRRRRDFKLRWHIRRFEQETGRLPTSTEVMSELGGSTVEVLLALDRYRVASGQKASDSSAR